VVVIKAIVFDCFGVLIENTLAQQPNEALLAYIRDELKPAYKIGMLSNAAPHAPTQYLTPEQLKLFDAVVVSGETGYAKPERQAYEAVARQLGVQLDEMVFIDDLARFTEPAEAFGIPSVLFTSVAALRLRLRDLLA
jgi:putative hydrolase of the HAD superfamily